MVWQIPIPAPNEAARVRALAALHLVGAEEERFDRISRLASRFYQADAAYIGVIDAGHQWLVSHCGSPLPDSLPREDAICNTMIETGEPLVVGDLWSDERIAGHPLASVQPLRFYAGVPLTVENDLVIGSLCVLKQDPIDPAQFDIDPLRDFAATAMDEIDLWKRNRELSYLAETDALTQIANRRGFDGALDRAIRRVGRTKQPIALLLFDIDHFKCLNDRLGHQAGDDALRRFADVIAATAHRPYDLAARYGGEEFALILPDTDLAGAIEIAAEVRPALTVAAIPHPAGGSLTASVGAASMEGLSDRTALQLIARADRALYAAKAAGRDRAVAASLVAA